MKFCVKTTLKASALSHLGGIIGTGYYDTQSLNFPAELKDILIAEAEDPRGLVECLDPEDTVDVIEIEEYKDVSSEVLDNISSGEGKAEESRDTPPLGAQDDMVLEKAAQAPSPISTPWGTSRPPRAGCPSRRTWRSSASRAAWPRTSCPMTFGAPRTSRASLIPTSAWPSWPASPCSWPFRRRLL